MSSKNILYLIMINTIAYSMGLSIGEPDFYESGYELESGSGEDKNNKLNISCLLIYISPLILVASIIILCGLYILLFYVCYPKCIQIKKRFNC
jgi:hypothetical protein